MTERDFELRLASAVRDHVGHITSDVDPVELAHRIVTATPRRRAFALTLAWREAPIPSRLWVPVLLTALLAAVLGGMLLAGSQSSSLPLGLVATPTPSAAAPPSPGSGVVVTSDVAYETSNPVLTPGVLDVYAPMATGPWPVAVMFHGFHDSKDTLAVGASMVAARGFVVFVPNWDTTKPERERTLLAANAQAACAVTFAQRQAAAYGGNAARTVVYGWSAGAHVAAAVAFDRPETTPGCLGGGALEPISALIAWAGSWVLSVNTPDWDAILAADPKAMDAATPWQHLASQPDLRVTILVAEEPLARLAREVADPWAADSWLALRDPSGDLRRRLETNGAFADGTLDWLEVQQLLLTALQAQGNPVSLDVLPDSTEESLQGGGWDVFVAAFSKAAAVSN
jgi:acetyl esterase/lipase